MKLRRIVAAIGLIILVLTYVATLFFAITDDPATAYFFRASIFLSIVIPVSLYGFMLFHKAMNRKNEIQDLKDDDDQAS